MFSENTESWFEFSAYNSESLYGYGTAEQAAAWCEHLNRGREVNVYGFGVAEGECAEYCDAWSDLADELAHAEEQVEREERVRLEEASRQEEQASGMEL